MLKAKVANVIFGRYCLFCLRLYSAVRMACVEGHYFIFHFLSFYSLYFRFLYIPFFLLSLRISHCLPPAPANLARNLGIAVAS